MKTTPAVPEVNAIVGVPGSLWCFDAEIVPSQLGREPRRGLVYPRLPHTGPWWMVVASEQVCRLGSCKPGRPHWNSAAWIHQRPALPVACLCSWKGSGALCTLKLHTHCRGPGDAEAAGRAWSFFLHVSAGRWRSSWHPWRVVQLTFSWHLKEIQILERLAGDKGVGIQVTEAVLQRRWLLPPGGRGPRWNGPGGCGQRWPAVGTPACRSFKGT